MGCCSSRNSMSIEDHLILFESTFKFDSIPVTDFDFLSHKFSRNLKISNQQFPVLCKGLKIESKSPGHEFLQSLYDEKSKTYDAKILTTLGILYGCGRDDEKLKLLFKNYDEDFSSELDKEEIHSMINHILTVSIDFVFTYARSKIPESRVFELNEYFGELSNSKRIMVSVYTANLMKDSNLITLNSFLEEFKDYSLSVLLSPKKIRTIGKDMIKNLLILAKKVNFVVENEIKINTAIARRLSLRVSKKLRKKGGKTPRSKDS